MMKKIENYLICVRNGISTASTKGAADITSIAERASDVVHNSEGVNGELKRATDVV